MSNANPFAGTFRKQPYVRRVAPWAREIDTRKAAGGTVVVTVVHHVDGVAGAPEREAMPTAAGAVVMAGAAEHLLRMWEHAVPLAVPTRKRVSVDEAYAQAMGRS